LYNPQEPNREEAMNAFLPAAPFLNRAYDYAISKATNHFKDRDINPYLHAGIVRDEVFKYLADHQQLLPFAVRGLPNSGILLFIQAYAVRTRKGVDENLPPAGQSKTLQSFYRQIIHYQRARRNKFAMLSSQQKRKQMIQMQLPLPLYNLVLLWNVTSKYTFKGLSIVAPKDGDERSAEVFWRERIPLVIPQSTAPSNTEVVEDLDLYHLIDEPDLSEDDLDEGGQAK
jgi:hypothetical protein